MGAGVGTLARTAAAFAIVFTTAGGCGEWRAGAGSALEREGRPLQDPARNTELAQAGDARPLVESGHHPWLTWPDFPHFQSALRDLYAAEADGLFWFEAGQPVATLQGAVAGLGEAGAHGLNARDYDAQAIADRYARFASVPRPGSNIAEFDLAVSIAAARLLAAVHEGRVDPQTVGFKYDVAARRLDAVRALRLAREHGFEAALRDAAPTTPVYVRLLGALRTYQALAAAGEPPAVPALTRGQKKIEQGAEWDGTPALAERLRVFGDLPAPPSAAGAGPAVYDGALVEAVKRFQGRHALEPDGVIGAGTISALNVPLARRVRQIELALERERWLPDTRSRPVIFVNVPLFRLWAYDPERPNEPLGMSIVVGKSLGHATPLFVEEMEYVVFSPFWNPPPSILRHEIVPNVRRDAGYLARENMEIVASGAFDALALPPTDENLERVLNGTLFLRQRPGPKNSLGQAKFMFPNADNVYMHGTPAKQLFSRARRDFSHGCIRVEDAHRLAEWVLRNQPEWTHAKIGAAMAGGTPVQVNLKDNLTVLIFYDTVDVDPEGVVHFADDYYGHDARLEASLEKGYPYPRKH